LVGCCFVVLIWGFSCVGVFCFWFALLESSVEGGWMMLFLLLPAFFTWLGPMDAGGWLLMLLLQLLMVDVGGRRF
jgi:hypothetical protein